MRLDHIGPFGFYNRFKDDWLVSRRAVKLFLLATIFVVATIPIFFGLMDPTKLPVWTGLPVSIEGLLGAISIFFLWIGMWRYWIRLDNSSKPAKLVSFLLLLFGMFYGSVLYYFFVYRPQVRSGSWAKPAIFSREEKNVRPSSGLQKVFFVGILSLFGLALTFGLLLPILLKKFLPRQSDSKYEVILGLGFSIGVISFCVFLFAMLFRIGASTRREGNGRPRWGPREIMLAGLVSVLGFMLVFGFLVPTLLKKILPPEYEDNYEVYFGLGLVLAAVFLLLSLIVMLFLTVTKARHNENVHPRCGLQKTLLIGFISLFGFMLVFGLLFPVLLRKILPQFVDGYSVFLSFVMVLGIISIFLYLIVGVFRLGMKTHG